MSKHFLVEFQIPYIHTVRVDVTAETVEDAEARVEAIFDEGTLWDDTKDCRLVYDDFDEDGDAGVPLEFVAVSRSGRASPFQAARCVERVREQAAARRACELLLVLRDYAEASNNPELVGKLKLACEQARQGLGEIPASPLNDGPWG